MPETQTQKQLNKQVQSAMSEIGRLKTLAKELEVSLSERKAEVDKEITALDGSIKDKKDALATAKNLVEAKSLEVDTYQEKVEELQELAGEANKESKLLFVKKENVDAEIAHAVKTLAKTRETIIKEREESSKEMNAEKAVVSEAVEAKKAQLVTIEQSISKTAFVQKTAEEALAEINTRNSDAEKREKVLSNKASAVRKEVEDLTKKESDLLENIRMAKDNLKADNTRATEAAQEREKIEQELEEANKRLLSSTDKFETREQQIDAREEKLQQAYKKAGIEYPLI